MKLLFLITIGLSINCYVQARQYKVTDKVFFDIMIDDYPIGRIVIGLFGEDSPKTVKNFVKLASEGISGRTYTGSKFHRIIKKFMVQGGDIDKNDGSGSISIYGKYFDDEVNDIKHSGPGFISMANVGKNTNGCQFFITTVAAPWLDGLHTVFGKVLEGNDVLFRIEQAKTDVNDVPVSPVVILKSGKLPLNAPFFISDDPYDIWAWIRATAIPLSFSFTILAFFHWMIKQLDSNYLTMGEIDKYLATKQD